MFIINFNIQEEKKTKVIAQEISKICKKGDVLAISGSMGIGKTTFVSVSQTSTNKFKIQSFLNSCLRKQLTHLKQFRVITQQP